MVGVNHPPVVLSLVDLKVNKGFRIAGALMHVYIFRIFCQSLIDIISALYDAIDDTPPFDIEPGAVRFGNKAYRDWFVKMQEIVATELEKCLASIPGAATELTTYLSESFGNATRIDYGTGHETNFIAFCLALDKIGFLTKADDRAVVLALFNEYLLLCRRLQVKRLFGVLHSHFPVAFIICKKTNVTKKNAYCVQIDYRMEPAGSHGVHSLDDFQFLCYLYGSVQLGSQGDGLQPCDFPKQEVVDKYADKYMFLQVILQVHLTTGLR